MPWHVGTAKSCPASKPYAVVKDSDGSVAGCHPTRERARRQLAALYANEPAARTPRPTTSGGEWSETVSTDLLLPTRPCARSYAVEDLHVRSDGSGRVVEAYAAAFNSPAEVMDQDGHYKETLPPTSFTKTINDKGLAFGVLFNHGLTVDGAPNASATLPIGVPEQVVADERGVFTATRYLANPLADHVLDAIKNGAIRAQSFSGRFMKSTRSYPDGRGAGRLPLITRHEVDMREYGPAVFAAYKDAAILGTRAEVFIRALLATPTDERLQWLEQFEGLTTPLVEPEALPVGTPDGAAALADEPREHSARSISLRTHIRAARIARGME
jgi:HK97 family phage prohead protease